MNYLYLAIAIVAEVIATSFLKQSEGFARPVPTAIMAAGYIVAFYCLSLALRGIPTGVAYAIWSGVGIVLIAAIAWLFQGQKLDTPAMAGMGLIIAGVLVMNLFSKVAGH
ncbi:DMT family transporter [Novosphingobium sp.]|jgi:small multidrug resistance pump|uniref:DMT family transporter n=1 Tax=Novosphingobium sp. TaxID=1874826 RepID=UPI002FE0264D